MHNHMGSSRLDPVLGKFFPVMIGIGTKVRCSQFGDPCPTEILALSQMAYLSLI